jgi:molybdopterin-containing oxidoreductase family iron-sulfur binding subunit
MYPHFQHVVYEPFSVSAIRDANAKSFGSAIVPHYRFDKAKVIVGLEADFLGTWLSPVEFAHQYAEGRKSANDRSLHIQFESGLSVTGSNADVRIPVAPSEIGLVALALLRRVALKSGTESAPSAPEPFATPEQLDLIAGELWKHRGESLVVAGTNDVSVQVLISALNSLLGNLGKTIDLTQPSLQQGSDDAAMVELVDEMDSGKVHTLFIHGVNPAYDWQDPQRFLSALHKVDLSVAFSDRQDETSSQVHAICPDHHFLESWGDAEPVSSYFSLAQPLIAPLFDTRSAQDSLLKWGGNPDANSYSYLRDFWRQELFPRQKQVADFETFWEKSLRDGVALLPSGSTEQRPGFQGNWRAAGETVMHEYRQVQDAHDQDQYELHFYQTVALRDGRHANNPWLQELPDPISKVTWGNYAAVAPNTAERLGLKDGDVIRVRSDRGQIELPVFTQPGQQARTISIAVGYGRTKVGKVGNGVGANVYPLTSTVGNSRRYSALQVVVEKTGRRETVASTQSHFSMEGRPIVLETTLDELHKGENATKAEESLPTLWAERPSGEHAWGMAIDLDKCIGCSACVVACQAENNVPVLGKEEVTRTRIMHWIRIDRYYSGSADNPESLHQPMMCQHCQNAPCETVCPVLATTTSSEGLNQQVYNRCIGTRYCANNCPYKVRRFNWFNYTSNPEFDFNMANPVGRLVLNPDVVVRSRGVMEKCSLCVQRIQLAKNSALQGKRELRDGDIQTACQQACPTQAIVFGDLKDSGSRVSQLHANQRYYQALGELGVRPNVGYMKKIRNPMQTA